MYMLIGLSRLLCTVLISTLVFVLCSGLGWSRQAAFPEHLAPLLARVVQGSPLPLSKLSDEAMSVMKELCPAQAERLTVSQVAAKIRSVLLLLFLPICV